MTEDELKSQLLQDLSSASTQEEVDLIQQKLAALRK